MTTNLAPASEDPNGAAIAEPIWEAIVKAYDKEASRSRPTLCRSRM